MAAVVTILISESASVDDRYLEDHHGDARDDETALRGSRRS
jgi:hypothetical protein